MSMSSPLWAYSLRWYLSHSKRKLKISSLLPLSLIATNCPRSLSIPDRSVCPNYCAAHSLAPVNVHLLTPCVHKLLQGRLCLADLLHNYSMTELRQLSSRPWRLCNSIEDPQSWPIASSVLGQEPAIWCPP